MSNKGTINEIVDPAAYLQLDKLLKLLVNTRGELVGVTSTIKTMNDQIGNSKSIKEFETNTAKANDSLSKMVVSATNAQQAGNAFNATLLKTNQSLDTNIRQNLKLKLELSAVAEQQKALSTAYKNGVITQDVYTKGVVSLEKQQISVKNAITANNTAIKQNVKEQSYAADSAKANAVKLKNLRDAYDSLSQAEKNNANIGGVLLQNIKQLDAAQKSHNESTGRFQDNVGNYGKALEGLPGPIGTAIGSLKSLWTTLIANPIGLVVGALFLFYQALKQNDDASNTIAGVWRGLSVILQKLGEVYIKGVIKYFELLGKGLGFIQDKLSFIVDGINHFIDVNDKMLSLIPGYNDLKKSISGLVDETVAITKATIAYDRAIDDIEERQKTLNLSISKNNIEIQRADNIYKDSNKTLKVRLSALDQMSSLEQKNLAGKLNLLDKELAAEVKLNKVLTAGSVDKEASDFRIIDLQVKKNEAILEAEQLEGTIIKRRSKLIREVTKEDEDRNKKLADDAYALAKQRLEIQKEYFKTIESDENNSLEVRVAAMQAYAQRELDLLKLAYDKELKEQGLSNDKKTALKEKYDNDTAKANSELLSKINKASISEYRKAEADYDKYLETIQQKRVQTDKDTLFRIEAERDNALASIVGNSQDAVNKRIAIEKQFTMAFIDEQIKQAEAALKYQGATAEEEARLAALKRKRNEIENANFQEGWKTNVQAVSNFLRETSGIISESFSLLKTLSDNRYNAELSSINQVAKANDDKYNRDKSNIENSTLTESEKKIKLAILDKEKAAQDAKLEERQKQAAIAKAKRDRSIQIGQIIANTAIAVLSQLSIPGAGFGLAAAAAAVGALQLAAVLATPLPSYERGGTKQGDGYARVSEKGPELQIDPSGAVSLTPEKESVIYAKHGTKFISASETKRILANQTLTSQFKEAANVDFDVNKLIRSGERNTDRLTSKLSSKQTPHVSNNGRFTTYKTRA